MNAQSVGKFIAEQRKKSHITQQDLAVKLAVTNKAVSKWENGDCFPDMMLMPQIAEIFNCSVDEILNYSISGDSTTSKTRATGKMFLYNIVSASLLFVAVVLFFTLTYSTYLEVLGFGIMLLFVVAANIIWLCGLVKNKNRDFNDIKKQVRLFIGSSILIIFILLPYLLFDDKQFIKSVLSFDWYLFSLPIFVLIALSICQLLIPFLTYNISKQFGVISEKRSINLLVLFALPFLFLVYYKTMFFEQVILNNTNVGSKDTSILLFLLIGTIGIIAGTIISKKKLVFEDWIFLSALFSSLLIFLSASITMMGNISNDFHRNLRITLLLIYPCFAVISTGISALRRKLTKIGFLKIICASFLFAIGTECYILSADNVRYLFYIHIVLQLMIVAILILINIIQRLKAGKKAST